MDSLVSKLETWIPSKISETSKSGTNFNRSLVSMYTLNLPILFSPIIREFRKRIKTVTYQFRKGSLVAGAACFVSCCVLSMAQKGYIKNIDALFTFALCYILTDHYLDDNNISKDQKKETVKQLNKFINDPSPRQTSNENEIVQAVGSRYTDMINKIPSCSEHLKIIYNYELESTALQYKNNLNRQEYLTIAEKKGGLTFLAIQSLLEMEITNEEYKVGACIQLVDDLLDINEDIRDGINTIATHDLITNNNLDKLLIYTVKSICELNRVYNVFKVLLLPLLMFAVHTNKKMYSCEIIQILLPFIHFDESFNKRYLVDRINSFL